MCIPPEQVATVNNFKTTGSYSGNSHAAEVNIQLLQETVIGEVIGMIFFRHIYQHDHVS